MHMNYDQLQGAVAAAKKQFGLLLKKYPDLIPKTDGPMNPYLVMSLPGEQVGITCSAKDILKKIPTMVIDSSAKTKALALLSRIKTLERRDKADLEIKPLLQEYGQVASQLQYDGKTPIEIRFHLLDYNLIWKVQADDLIDRNLTSQSKASIRIVLGTLERFAFGQNAAEPATSKVSDEH